LFSKDILVSHLELRSPSRDVADVPYDFDISCTFAIRFLAEGKSSVNLVLTNRVLSPVNFRLEHVVESTMADKKFVVRWKLPENSNQTVVADRYEVQGDHLVFWAADGRLAGLFLMEAVESWSESDSSSPGSRIVSTSCTDLV